MRLTELRIARTRKLQCYLQNIISFVFNKLLEYIREFCLLCVFYLQQMAWKDKKHPALYTKLDALKKKSLKLPVIHFA